VAIKGVPESFKILFELRKAIAFLPFLAHKEIYELKDGKVFLRKIKYKKTV